MSEYVPEGALLPSGINVDETAAYFGITDSSQILLELENSNRHTCITIVLNKISDLLLTDTFDLDSGSNRLQVESGEIYYILTGPLELLKITENLQLFLGLNPEEITEKPEITEEQFSALELLLDPMNILKVYAIGDVTGGNNELAKYVNAFDKMMEDPSQNIQNLCQISKELTEILVETKNMQMPRAISMLKSAKAIQSPKLVTPHPPIQEKKSEQVSEIPPQEKVQENTQTTTSLQKPTALKPPTNKSNIIPTTPLIKPEILRKPVIVPKEEPKSMKELEKESLDTNNWINEGIEANEIKPVSKPVPIKENVPIRTRTYNSDNTINSNIQTSNLPKPVKKSFSEQKSSMNTNGIIRTFPNGNICKGCGVSLSNSWRFCPLCGFKNN